MTSSTVTQQATDARAQGRAVGPRPRTARRLARVLLYAFLTVGSIIVAIPLVSILSVALQPAGTPTTGLTWPATPAWSNFAAAWTTGHFSGLMLNSLIIAAVVVPGALTVSVLAGYALGTMRFRGSGPIFALFLIGLVMPFESTIVPLYYNLRGMGLVDTYTGVMLPEIALYSCFGVFWMRSFFRSTPRALIEAARIDGASNWRILVSVLLPLARPAILTLATLFFIWSWNEFLLALVVLTSPEHQTAPAGLGLFVGERTSDIPGLSAGAIIVSLPIIMLYALLNRKIISGMLQGAVKG